MSTTLVAVSDLGNVCGKLRVVICTLSLAAALVLRRKAMQALIVLGIAQTEESYAEMMAKKYNFSHWNRTLVHTCKR